MAIGRNQFLAFRRQNHRVTPGEFLQQFLVARRPCETQCAERGAGFGINDAPVLVGQIIALEKIPRHLFADGFGVGIRRPVLEKAGRFFTGIRFALLRDATSGQDCAERQCHCQPNR